MAQSLCAVSRKSIIMDFGMKPLPVANGLAYADNTLGRCLP